MPARNDRYRQSKRLRKAYAWSLLCKNTAAEKPKMGHSGTSVPARRDIKEGPVKLWGGELVCPQRDATAKRIRVAQTLSKLEVCKVQVWRGRGTRLGISKVHIADLLPKRETVEVNRKHELLCIPAFPSIPFKQSLLRLNWVHNCCAPL